ncbi:MAG: helix-turn-helix domain-containing protein [Epulopiscium sp.]|nr:helix-turn-helix domain-containing protein [Candidatus Epulonipiscium sp.]
MSPRKAKRIRDEKTKRQENPFSRSRKKLDEQTVLKAISGEPLALMKIVEIYEPYINKLSLRLVSTEDGDYTEQIDETVKKMLETSLIAAVMKFDPCKN